MKYFFSSTYAKMLNPLENLTEQIIRKIELELLENKINGVNRVKINKKKKEKQKRVKELEIKRKRK